MKVLIVDGAPEAGALGEKLAELDAELRRAGHTAETLTLRDLKVHHCVGCFNCWVRTPGLCSTDDDARQIARRFIASDLVLLASPIMMGHVSSLLRRGIERMLGLGLPYLELRNGESRHPPRYPHRPALAVLLEPSSATDDEDIEIIRETYRRTALNLDRPLMFVKTTAEPAEAIVRAMSAGPAVTLASAGRLSPPDWIAAPFKRLLVINGSPRKKSNTAILLGHFLEGLGQGYEVDEISVRHSFEESFPLELFTRADRVLLAFPLYFDAVPSVVKRFIEQLEPLCARPANPPLAFLVQSGFSEAFHSRAAEHYLHKLARRLHSPYLGTMIRGGVEGIQVMPDAMTRNLFASMRELGRGFGKTGALDRRLVARLAGPERHSTAAKLLFPLTRRMSAWYWDSRLKKNGAYERRFDRPYEPRA